MELLIRGWGQEMKMLEREQLCIELLRKLPQKFVLVGGYAASSFEFPRFSVDLDLVIQEKDVKEFARILEGEGFELATNAKEFTTFYKGRFMRFEKRIGGLPVSVDLLVNAIQARQTGTAYSFGYIRENSEIRRVLGSGTRESAEVRVADREMLIALKMNSMRATDQRDIITLCNGKIEVQKIAGHLRIAPQEKILKSMDIILGTLGNPSVKDSIKGVFGIPDKVYENMIEKAKQDILSIRKILSDAKT